MCLTHRRVNGVFILFWIFIHSYKTSNIMFFYEIGSTSTSQFVLFRSVGILFHVCSCLFVKIEQLYWGTNIERTPVQINEKFQGFSMLISRPTRHHRELCWLHCNLFTTKFKDEYWVESGWSFPKRVISNGQIFVAEVYQKWLYLNCEFKFTNSSTIIHKLFGIREWIKNTASSLTTFLHSIDYYSNYRNLLRFAHVETFWIESISNFYWVINIYADVWMWIYVKGVCFTFYMF